MKTINIIFLTVLLISGCAFSTKNKPDIYFEKESYSFRYDINSPDMVLKLPHDLREISGLTYLGKNRIACNQDEKGNIYIYDIKKGTLIKTVKFSGSGDYEALEVVGGDMWVIKSNGEMYQITDYDKEKKIKVHKHKTKFNATNNIEGLGYHPDKHTLLIACKGYPFIGKKHKKSAKKHKAVYRFDIEKEKLDKEPVFLISLDSIMHYKNYSTITWLGIELSSAINNAEGGVSFKPSGIAIHPVTGNIYILASIGKSLAVLSSEGKMLALVRLKKDIFKQPEGICFSPDGTLYISNEDKKRTGYILEFQQK